MLSFLTKFFALWSKMPKICSISAETGHFLACSRVRNTAPYWGCCRTVLLNRTSTVRQPVLTHSRTVVRYGIRYGRPSLSLFVHGEPEHCLEMSSGGRGVYSELERKNRRDRKSETSLNQL